MWQNQFQIVLKNTFEEAKRKGPFSLRSFASQLNVSPGALSEIISGDRKVSVQRALEILYMIPDNATDLINYLEKIANSRKAHRVLLPEHALEIITQWRYFALLSIIECDIHPQAIEKIAKRMGLSEEEVRESIDLLLQNGLIVQDTAGNYQATGIAWTTTDGIPSKAGRLAHVDSLHLAEKALHELPLEIRDFTTITFPGDRERFEVCRQEIRRFKERITKLMKGTSTNSVYKLNVQLLPLDQWDERHETSK